MSSENEEPQKKKLFEFDTLDVGIRSVNLLNNLNVKIPTSKWEITPRTATQSKRLKWDQTPFGAVKVESEIYKDNKIKSASGFSYKQQQNDFMFNKRLSIDEINTILPKIGYSIFNVWNNENIEQIDFQLFNEEEKLFFSELNETTDEDIKLIFKGLYILKKIKKNKSRRVLKIFYKCKDKKYALEKVILFCFCFNLTTNEKSLILKIINILLSETISIFRREVFYILAKFSEDEKLENECRESFMITFKNNFEDYKTVLEREIKECEKETKDLISKLLAIGIYIFGIRKHMIWFKSFCIFERSKEKMIILYSLILIVRKLGNSLRLFADELLDFIELIVKDCQNYIKSTSGHLINLMFEKHVLENSFRIFKRLLKIISNLINNKLLYKYIDNLHKDMLNLHLSQEKWIFVWVKALSFASVGNQDCSRITFNLLQKCKLNDENIFKVLNNLVLDIKELENFAKQHLDSCFKEDYKKSLIIFIKRLKNSAVIREKLISLILDAEKTNMTLEIIVESKSIYYLIDAFFENFYVILKNMAVTNRRLLKWIFRNTQNVNYLKDLFLNQINQNDEKLFGFIYLAELVEFLDKNSLLYIGKIIWEKIDNFEGRKLIESFNLLNKIYKRTKFQSFGEIIYLCSSKLKTGDKNTKKMIFKFLSNVIKNNVNEAISFNRMEFMRICFEASDCLIEVGEKSRRVIINFVKNLGRFVNLQDLVDVFLIKLYESETYKGIIEVLAEISTQYGLFYVLPKIMIKYETSSYSIRLRICKFIIRFIKLKKSIDERYFSTIILIIEDLLLDKEIEMRKFALRLISALVNSLTPPTTHTDIIIHLLNLCWFCVLDEIEFEECWKSFIKTLGNEVLVKYLLQGLYHPNKKIRTKYETLYNKLKFN